MIPQGFGYHPPSDEHHWMLASVAVLLSAFFHLSILYYFADYNLSKSNLAERTRRAFSHEYKPPMHVETIQIDPLTAPEKIPGERDIPNRGAVEIKALESAVSQDPSAALTAPPPLPREALTVETQPQTSAIDNNPWIPRQAIYDIHDQKIKDELAALPIRDIPQIERVPEALDIIPQMDFSGKEGTKIPDPPARTRPDLLDTALTKGPLVMPHIDNLSMEAALLRFGTATVKAATPPPTELMPPPVPPPPKSLPPEERKVVDAQNKIEAIRETVNYTPIDATLSASLVTYKESDSLYFKVSIQPRKDKTIPIIPKDVIWILDVSASMTEERLAFCRRALIQALETMNPQDRFTVIAFRDSVFQAFPAGWQAVNPDTIKKAATFIEGLRCFGTTDVLVSLRTLMTLPRDPTRPMIALIVSDGKPTAGMTESSGIIGAFSRLNKGMISIYTFGTHRDANAYLLDMLTYSNRGHSTIIKGNRWDIPEGMAEVYLGFRNPVLSDASIIFDATSNSEVYPRRTSNLYKDHPIEVFGKCAATETEVIFQIRGLAGDKGYDSIFRLPLTAATPGSSSLKTRWASQKMFMLASLYSREAENRSLIFDTMKQLGRTYGVELLYPSDIK